MEFKPGHTVGIDLGTTFSTLAILDENGDPVPIANDDDEIETPSLILLAESGHVVVGPARMRAAVEDPANVIDRVKRFMGNADYKRTFDGREITPEFLSALILKKLRQDAEKRIGKIGNAVITVPYYFNESRRKATEDAGRIAGLNVVGVLNEPTAATLTYAWARGELGGVEKAGARPHVAMVYDLGGGTFDVTAVRYTPTHFQVLATDGDVHLGGLDWNDRVVDYVANEFQARHQLDPRLSPAALQYLRFDCDQAKIALTTDDKTTINCRFQGKALAIPLTRAHFQELTADLLQRTLDTAELVLEQAKLKTSDLDAIVLVGGSTLMPKVGEALAGMTGKEPDRTLSPHTAVAQGAAIHAAILEAKYHGEKSVLSDRIRKRLIGVRQEDVNSHGLGIVARNAKTGKKINHVMIPRNSKLPIEVRRTFATNEDGQQRVRLRVTEGDAPDPAACSLLGECVISNLPKNLPRKSPIEVTYAFGADGRVRVSAIDKTGGQQASIEIERRGSLDQDQLTAFTNLAEQYSVE
jgi:molecular chaperone DnaK